MKATTAAWSLAFARQAQADFYVWQALELNNDAHPCHRMLLLQMACEKICKSRLMNDRGTLPADLQSSHGFVANPLPTVIRAQLEFLGEDLRTKSAFLQFTRHLAAEIEILNPAMKRDGKRPDNCEYPWEHGNTLHSPLDWQFIPQQLLHEKFGPLFVKMLRMSICRAVEELQNSQP
jgi:hypothetical protein